MSHRAPAPALLILGLCACRGTPAFDGGPGGPDGSTSDAAEVDGSARDLGPHMEFDGSFVYDSGLRTDAMPRILDAEIAPDIGPPGPGEVCTTARAWPRFPAPVLGRTSSSSLHRDPLGCAGTGAGTDAPDIWWKLTATTPAHLILRLGTAGFDGVLAARTGTCTRGEEECGNAPPVVELPAVMGAVYVGASAFSTGFGRYVVSADVSPALSLAENATCSQAAPALIPSVTLGHNFGGTLSPLAGCALDDPVFYGVSLPSRAMISIRVEPLASQPVGLALFTAGCGSDPLECTAGPEKGVAATLGPLDLASGAYAIAVGRASGFGRAGSFRLSIAKDAGCLFGASCPIDQVCTSSLACARPPGFISTSSAAAAIPDGASSLDLPIDLAGPSTRPSRVRLRLALQHSAPENLVVELVSPASPDPVRVRLRDRVPGNLETVYGQDRDAQGPGTLEDFRLLESAAGRWTLHVEDRVRGDSGFVSRYALIVE